MLTTGVVTTLAGTASVAGYADGTSAQFNTITAIALDPTGTYALVSDYGNALIRRVDMQTGAVTTVVGQWLSRGTTSGVGTAALLTSVYGMQITPDGSRAIITDMNAGLVRSISLPSYNVTNIAGFPQAVNHQDGVGTFAFFSFPYGIVLTTDGLTAYVTEYMGNTIRKVNLTSSEVTTVAGVAGMTGTDDGYVNSLSSPTFMIMSPLGDSLLFVDYSGRRIRRLSLSDGYVSTLAGSTGGTLDGVGSMAQLQTVSGLFMSPDLSYLLVTQKQVLGGLRKIFLSNASVVTVDAGLSEPWSIGGVAANLTCLVQITSTAVTTSTIAPTTTVTTTAVATTAITTAANTTAAITTAAVTAAAITTAGNTTAVMTTTTNTTAMPPIPANTNIATMARLNPVTRAGAATTAVPSVTQAAVSQSSGAVDAGVIAGATIGGVVGVAAIGGGVYAAVHFGVVSGVALGARVGVVRARMWRYGRL